MQVLKRSLNLSRASQSFPKQTWLSRVCSTGLVKILWPAIFRFPRVVFLPVGELSVIFIKFKNFGLQTFSVWKPKFVVLESRYWHGKNIARCTPGKHG